MKKKIILALIFVGLSIIVVDKSGVSAETTGIYTYEIAENEAIITSCSSSVKGSIEIPSTLGGYPVTTIGDSAFEWCKSITSIKIPNSVTTIGNRAFLGHSDALVYVTLGDNVKEIGDSAFAYSGLQSINIPDSVKKIGDSAFESCLRLSHIAIPSSVTTIGAAAFYNCSGLERLIIGDNLSSGNATIIESSAFELCSKLSSVVMHENISSLGNKVFANCVNLLYVKIPHSVTSIGSSVFKTCSASLTIQAPIALKESETEWKKDCSAYANYYCVINYVGDYQGYSTVSYGGNADLTIFPTESICTLTVEGRKWDGKHITEDVIVHVSLKYISATVSEDGKSFIIRLTDIDIGNTVIFALYYYGSLADVQTTIYEGNEIPFTTTSTYTEVKVMVWESLVSVKPICKSEEIKQDTGFAGAGNSLAVVSGVFKDINGSGIEVSVLDELRDDGSVNIATDDFDYEQHFDFSVGDVVSFKTCNYDAKKDLRLNS